MRWLMGVFVLCACDSDHIDVSWSFKDLATGAAMRCPDGFDRAELQVRPVYEYVVSHTSGGTSWSSNGWEAHRSYDCADGAGETYSLAPGDDDRERGEDWDLREGYDVKVVFTSVSGEYAGESTTKYRDADTPGSAHFELVSGGGYFQLSWARFGFWTWSFCAGVHAIRINVEGATDVSSEIIECSGFRPIHDDLHPRWLYTAGFPAGTYRAWVDQLDENWQTESTWISEPMTLGANSDIQSLSLQMSDVP